MSTVITSDTTGQVPAPRGPERSEERPPQRPSNRRHQILWAVGVVAVLVLLVAGVLVGITAALAGQVNRVPAVFSPLNAAARPAAGVGQTFLLVGNDSSTPDTQRSSAVMLVTVSPDGDHTSLVSFPRDAWVNVPGHGMATISSAYATGGPTLLVSTVEGLTGVRVDHFATIDFAGYGQMADAAGGITVDVAAPTSNDGVTFRAGSQRLDGQQAVAYITQVNGLPGGDLDRVRREQNGLRALVSGATVSGAASNPIDTYQLGDVITKHMTVDDTMSNGDLRSLAWGLWDLRTRNMIFLTAPVTGPAVMNGQPVLLLNAQQGKDLWSAMSSDQVAGYITSHPGSALLPVAPR